MKEEAIRIWFYSRDNSFAEILARALGPGYEICQGDLDSARDIDAILLDAASNGPGECEDLLHSIRTSLKTSPVPTPIIAMVHEDEQETVHALTENGVYETLASPPDIRGKRDWTSTRKTGSYRSHRRGSILPCDECGRPRPTSR